MLYTMLGCLLASCAKREPCRYVLIQGSAFAVDKMPKPADLTQKEAHHVLKHEAFKKTVSEAFLLRLAMRTTSLLLVSSFASPSLGAALCK